MKRAMDFQECKLLSWLKAATSVVVHSKFAARAVAPYLIGKKLYVVPHFAYRPRAAVPTPAHGRMAARAKLGLEEDQFVISTVGFVTRNKQYDAIMRAFVQLPAPVRRKMVFLIAGEIREHEYDLLDQVKTLGCGEFIRTTGFLSEEQMQNVLNASDLVMSLRYPTYGESSGSVARALGLGCAVVVTDGGSYSELPDNVCMKIPAKADPSKEVAELIRAAVEDRNALIGIRSAAVEYAQGSLDAAKIAVRYSEIAHA